MATEPTPQPVATPRPAPVARSDAEMKAAREARIAASHGAQVVLDPTSDAALAARGAMEDTIEGNAEAYRRAMTARAGKPAEAVIVVAPRDPVSDPESDAALAARGVKPAA